MYTESKVLYKLTSLSNAQLQAASTSVAKLTWTPIKRWEVCGAVINPTTAVGASATCVIRLKHTPSGGSLTSKLTVTVTTGLAVGTEQAFTAYTTGSDVFDLDTSDTLGVYVDTALGAVAGVLDVFLILREKPA